MLKKLKNILGIKNNNPKLNEDEARFLLYLINYSIHGENIYLKYEKRESKLHKPKDEILEDLLNLLEILCNKKEDSVFKKNIKEKLTQVKIGKYFEIETLFELKTIGNVVKIIDDISNIQNDYLVEKVEEAKKDETKREKYRHEIECYTNIVDEDWKKIKKLMFERVDVRVLSEVLINDIENL